MLRLSTRIVTATSTSAEVSKGFSIMELKNSLNFFVLFSRKRIEWGPSKIKIAIKT
jgi:hypothetical protein